MRKYQPIWEKLKTDGLVTIEYTHKDYIRSLKKAVIKEKYQEPDHIFKAGRLSFITSQTPKTITIFLKLGD